MPQVLKLLQLAEEDGVAKMQIRSSGIEAGFHAQRPAALQFLYELRLDQELVRAAPDGFDLLFDWRQGAITGASPAFTITRYGLLR
jgi:hypothetical protein